MTLGGRKVFNAVMVEGNMSKTLETGRCVLVITAGCAVDIKFVVLNIML